MDCRDCKRNNSVTIDSGWATVQCRFVYNAQIELNAKGKMDIVCAKFVQMSALEKAIKVARKEVKDD